MKRSQRLMLEDLAKSGLDENDAKAAHFVALSRNQVARLTNRDNRRVCAAKYPFYDENNADTGYYQLKVLEPLLNKDGEPIKSLNKPDEPPQLYIPRIPKIARLFKERQVFGVAEGVKKSIKASKEFETTVGLLSADSFSSRKRGIDFLEDLKRLAALGAECIVTFDGDGHMNEKIRRAEQRFCTLFTEYGGRAYIRHLPPMMQYDDFLKREGAEGARRLRVTAFDVKSHVSFVRRTSSKLLPAHDKKQKIAEIVISDMKQRGAFFDTPDGPAYYDSVGTRPIDLSDKQEVTLQCHFNETYGINGSEDEYSFVYNNTLTEAMSSRSTKTTINCFSHFDSKKGALYISRSETEVFRVDESGYELVSNGTDGVILRAPANMAPIKISKKEPTDRAFESILDTPNLVDGECTTAEEMRLLFEIWSWAIICGRDVVPTCPIVLSHGPKGSGKSMAGKAIARTLYGGNEDVLAIDTRRMDGIDAALTHKHLVVLDNVDGKVAGLENRMASAATGSSLTIRKLYSSNALMQIPVRAFLMVTSREPSSFTRDDLVDRLLYLKVDTRKDFVAESQIMEKVSRRRGAWWKYVLSVLPKIVAALNNRTRRSVDFRMADFASFALDIAPVLGYSEREVIKALRNGEREKVAFVAKQTDLPDALAALVERMAKIDSRESYDGKIAASFFDSWHSATSLLSYLGDQSGFDRAMTASKLGQLLTQNWKSIKLRVPCIQRKEDSHAKTLSYRFLRAGVEK